MTETLSNSSSLLWRRLSSGVGAFGIGLTLSFCLATAYGADPAPQQSTPAPQPAQPPAADQAPGKQPETAQRQQQAGDSEAADSTSPARVRLISQEQYFNTVAYIFGPDVTVSAHFAPFRRTDGLLEVGAATAGVTSGQMQEFQRTAGALADRVVNPEHRNFLIPCTPSNEKKADKGCAKKFLTSVARLLYRRPLTKDEQMELVNQANDAANRLKDFYAGLSVALEGILVSPEVLFIVDRSEDDPQSPGHRRLDSFSLASRLSFLFWNAAPDDDLLRMAEKGDLQTPEGKTRAIDYLLASPRLEVGVRAFFDDMLGFDDFAVLAKDPGIYPAFVGDTVQDAREQTLRTIVDHLIVRKLDYRDLFTTRHTFMSPSLATLYGVATPPGWTPYEIPADSERVGLLTQIAFLASHAHPGRSSPTLRGKALRELLLCQTVPRPPPNVDFSLIEDPKSTLRTARERLAAHRANPVCAGCHKITDPIGLALENFDGAGQFRETERGAPIDASGSLDGKNFSNPLGLAQAVHDNPGLTSCVVRRAYAYGTGGPVKPNDKAVLPYLNNRFAAAQYRFPDLLRTIALSHAFSHVSEQAPAPPPAKTAATAPASVPPVAGTLSADRQTGAKK